MNQIQSQVKCCTKCSIEKPLSDFSPQKLGKFGVTSKCRPCARMAVSDWAKVNRLKLSKKLTEWRSKNREKVKSNERAYYARTKEKRIESVIKWQRSNPHNKRMSGASYRANNKDALKEWRYKNRGLVYHHNNSRKEIKRHATPTWLTVYDRSVMKTIYQMSNRLSKCTGIKHHVDHIYPLNAVNCCGLHVPWNLRAIPARLNLKKKNSLGGNNY